MSTQIRQYFIIISTSGIKILRFHALMSNFALTNKCLTTDLIFVTS